MQRSVGALAFTSLQCCCHAYFSNEIEKCAACKMKPALFVCICRQVHLSLCMCHGCTSVYEYLVVFVQTFAAALGVRFLACLRAVIALSLKAVLSVDYSCVVHT